MKTTLKWLDPRHWLGMATDKPTPGLFDPNNQTQGGVPLEVRYKTEGELRKFADEAYRRSQGLVPNNTLGSAIGRAAITSQSQAAYQQARANADYEAAMAARKKEIHVKIVPGSNGWVVEMEGQDPWVCKDITELGETITSAIGVRVLEGGSK